MVAQGDTIPIDQLHGLLKRPGRASPTHSRREKRKRTTTGERPAFVGMCVAAGLPAPVAEYRFHDARRWMFDYGWPAQMIALEVEGAVWTQGRHTRGSGFVKDMEKYNAAAQRGWTLIRCTTDQMKSGEALVLVRDTLAARGWMP